ncbi:alcohol dehydrogenase catalytic domain-containing protein [Streptomyces sp. TLI_171]|uniref:alcohol dehydrogenase catalytic domain-containing protein n=1 Tax=Streptomyces sp. TLI_171 TaxID=1938859 RepID=UPI00217E737C|nr:alcohol dehydrogenase catalytic domain-containing protein [Streptomyces sp. TLI_171]
MEICPAELVEPGRGQVRIAVEAAGICNTDAMFAAGLIPGVAFPFVPGHEIAGRVDAAGEGTTAGVGDRVAVGWFGGSCGVCLPCRRGDLITCRALKVPGWSYPGGYASHVVVPQEALAAIPDGMSAEHAAPMGCAGVTAFNALRRSGARPGELVAVLGLGGVGHLALQFAVHSGLDTVAVVRGSQKARLAKDLGAHHVVDASAADPVQALQALGGADVVLATAASAPAMSAVLGGLAPRARFMVVGVDSEPLAIDTMLLVAEGHTVIGHPAGTAADTEAAMEFCVRTGVRPWVEPVPLDRAADAFTKMLAGAARFRMVLIP